MSLYKLFLKSYKNNSKRYYMFMMTCLIAVVGLFTALSLRFAAAHLEINDNVIPMINSSCFLVVLISVVFIRYAIISYINIRIDDYEIYSILGMPVKSERRMILCEFAGMSFFVMIVGECIGSLFILLFRAICLRYLYLPVNNYLDIHIYILSMLLFIALLAISVFLYMTKKKKKLKKRQKMKVNKGMVGYCSLVIGLLLMIISVILIVNFTVGNMILAIIINPTGLFLLFVFLQNVILPFVKDKENIYYKRLVLLNDLFEDFSNKRLIAFAVYTSNFLLLYILSSMFVDLMDSDVPYDKYFKYDVVIESSDVNVINRLKHTDNSYFCRYKLCDIVGTQIYDDAQIITNSDYNYIMNKNMKLADNDVYIFVQRYEEDFLPVNTGKDTIDVNGKLYDINIINAGWEYLYTCLDPVDKNFIVVSDQLYNDLPGKEGGILFMNHVSSSDYENYFVSDKSEITVYDKKTLTGTIKLQNLFTFFTFFSISFLLFLDGSFIIFVKIYSDSPEKKLKLEMLELIGMKKKKIKKNFMLNYKIIIDVPLYMSLVFALFLGICNIAAGPDLNFNYMIEYIFFLSLTFVIEILYVFFLRKKIMKEIM